MAGTGDESGAADTFVSFLENSPQRYQSAKALILERRVLLVKAGVDVLKPCSGGDDEPCWLRHHLFALNDVFTKAALEVTVHSAAGLAIKPAFGLYSKEEDLVIADFLKDWLLAQHVCIHELKLHWPGEACWVLFGVRRLDVYGVPVKSIAKAVKGAKRLASLRVVEAEDVEDKVDDLASALRQNASLKDLEFCYNKFPPGSFKTIFEALSVCDKLESLCLENETVSSGDIDALQNLLKKCSSLKKLELACIDEVYISRVTSEPVEGSPLEELHLFGVECASDVHESLPLSFTGILSNLRVLQLSWCIIKDDAATSVAEHLSQNTSLKVVDLSWSRLGEAGVFALAAAMQRNTTLEILCLSGNELSAAAFLALAEALNVNETLKELNIFDIDLSCESSNQLFDLDRFPGLFRRAYIFWQQARLKELATIVRANNHHALLSLEIDDSVSSSDLDALFDALCVNTTVKTLSFSSECKLFPAFASRLASFLRINTSVGRIEVRLEDDKEVLLLEILEALKENKAVWRYDASCVEVTPAIARAVRDLLRTNTALNILSLCLRDVEKLDEEALHLIADGLQENSTIVDIHLAREPRVVDGLPEIWQLLARNKSLVCLAALCVTGAERSPEALEALIVTRNSHALVEKVAEMSGKTEELAKEAIAEAAGRLLDS